METNKTITINGVDYKVRSTLRSLFIFERIAEKPFEIKTSLDNFLFLYSVILACNPESVLKWDEFIDALDRDSSIVDRMNEILKDRSEVEKLIEGENTQEEGQKKN